MPNMPNITSIEVAVVCTAALLLCIMPNVLVWADVRRRRRVARLARNADMTMERRSVDVAGAGVASPLTVQEPAVDSSDAPQAVESDAVAIAAAEATAPSSAMAPLDIVADTAVETPVVEESPAATTPASSQSATPARFAMPVTDESARYTLRLDELRKVKLPNWPPAEVRDDPEKRHVWSEAQRVAEQPLIASMPLKSAREAESACLSAAESEGSILRLHFLLFADMWPVAATQATAEAIFEIDSATGQVRGAIRAL